jgi:hypothetical protein
VNFVRYLVSAIEPAVEASARVRWLGRYTQGTVPATDQVLLAFASLTTYLLNQLLFYRKHHEQVCIPPASIRISSAPGAQQ